MSAPSEKESATPLTAPTSHGRLRPVDILLLTALVALAAYFLFAWDLTTGHGGFMSLDTYGYYYPNMLHALHSVSDGGRGLLWNALQDCGQPFFGTSSTGILSPLNLPFWLLGDPDRALRAVIVLNLAVAGIGAYLLGRELGLSRPAALGSAMAFELGCSTLDLVTWTPMVSGPFVWLPSAMLLCERAIRRPTPLIAIGLGVTLAVALLPGFPQIVWFTYQLIGFRVAWEMVARRGRGLAIVATVVAGLALAPLLAAVQLIPGIQVAQASVRGENLSPSELSPRGPLQWNEFRLGFTRRFDIFNPFIVGPAAVAAASLAAAHTRRRALPYAVAGALFFTLAFGTSTPLFDLYARLPLSALFRDPTRFFWMADFCLSVLTGLGIEALRTSATAHGWLRRLAPVGAVVLALCALNALDLRGLRASEWILGSAVAAAAMVAALAPSLSGVAVVVIISAIGVDMIGFPLVGVTGPALNAWTTRTLTLRRLLHSGEELQAGAPVLLAIKDRMTPQDRAYVVRHQILPYLLPKSIALFGIPTADDYEPQPSRRFAAYLLMMRLGEHMESLNEYYHPLLGTMPPGRFQRPMLDLSAGRFLVADAHDDTTSHALDPPPIPAGTNDALRAYENPLALPRAFYVPRVEVVADESHVLDRLASGSDDLRQVALVEERPSSGFLGSTANQDVGTVTFERNDPEHVTLRVRAPARGFVHLADQYAPGWQVTVDGQASKILRANSVFRVVEVPAGESVVDFRYRPMSVLVGAIVSLLSLLGVGVVLIRSLRARQRAA